MQGLVLGRGESSVTTQGLHGTDLPEMNKGVVRQQTNKKSSRVVFQVHTSAKGESTLREGDGEAGVSTERHGLMGSSAC